MSTNVQAGLEDIVDGRPAFDDPHWYSDVHETIREHRATLPMVALCFECMENPKPDPTIIGVDENGKSIFGTTPLRCESCAYKHALRKRIAANAKGGY